MRPQPVLSPLVAVTSGLFHDVRHAARQLRAKPAFTLLVVLTVALGIGANTAIFSMINGFLRPLPVPEPDRLVVLAAQPKGDETGFQYRFSYPALGDFRQQIDSFSDIFGYTTMVAGLQEGGKVTQFLYQAVTSNLFTGLGVKPAAGRLLLPGEGEQPGSELVLILGYSTWQKRFGGDPAVVGRRVRLNGQSATVIGIVPRDFHGLYAGVEMDGYLPLNSLASVYTGNWQDYATNRTQRLLTLVGRLKPGVALAQAAKDTSLSAQRLTEEYPSTDKDPGVRLFPETLARPLPLRHVAERIPLVRGLVLVLAAIVLLLACVNVANIMLVRATVRQREMAIRAALGAGRRRLIRQMLTETTLLALAGALGGLLLGRWGSDAFAGTLDVASDYPIRIDFSFDWRVFAYALASTVFTGIVIGLCPALRASRVDAGSVLHDNSRSDASGGGQGRVRSALVVVQVACSLVLLIAAGLFTRSLQRAQQLDLGFDVEHVLNARLDPSQLGYNRSRADQFYRELIRRVRAVPGVQSASLAYNGAHGVHARVAARLPRGACDVLRRAASHRRLQQCRPCLFRDDADSDPARPRVSRNRHRRWSASRDRERDDGATVSGRVRTQWDSSSAPRRTVLRGRSSAWRGPASTLVVFEEPLPYVYVPAAQVITSMRVLQVRTEGAPDRLKARIRGEIEALDADMPIADFQTMRQSLSGGMGFMLFRVAARQAGALGLLGLVLAVIGVYGVVSHAAAQRTARNRHSGGARSDAGRCPWAGAGPGVTAGGRRRRARDISSVRPHPTGRQVSASVRHGRSADDGRDRDRACRDRPRGLLHPDPPRHADGSTGCAAPRVTSVGRFPPRTSRESLAGWSPPRPLAVAPSRSRVSSSILTFPIRSAIARSISAYRGAMGCLEPGGGIDVGTSSRRYEDWTEARGGILEPSRLERRAAPSRAHSTGRHPIRGGHVSGILLRSQRNYFFTVLSENGLDAREFRWEESPGSLQLLHVRSGYAFSLLRKTIPGKAGTLLIEYEIGISPGVTKIRDVETCDEGDWARLSGLHREVGRPPRSRTARARPLGVDPGNRNPWRRGPSRRQQPIYARRADRRVSRRRRSRALRQAHRHPRPRATDPGGSQSRVRG